MVEELVAIEVEGPKEKGIFEKRTTPMRHYVVDVYAALLHLELEGFLSSAFRSFFLANLIISSEIMYEP